MIWNFHPSSLSSMTGFREWLTPILRKKVNFRNEFVMGKGGGRGAALENFGKKKKRGSSGKIRTEKEQFSPKFLYYTPSQLLLSVKTIYIN